MAAAALRDPLQEENSGHKPGRGLVPIVGLLPGHLAGEGSLSNTGCWYGMEDEEAFSVQKVSVEQISPGKSLHPDPSIQKTQPCEKCVARRGIWYLAEYQESHPGQESHTCEACGQQFWASPNLHQHQKHNAERPFKRDVDRASFVTSCKFRVSGKPFTCEEVGKDFLALLWEKPHLYHLAGSRFQQCVRHPVQSGRAACIAALSPLGRLGGFVVLTYGLGARDAADLAVTWRRLELS
ncbi:hypothetical protein CB1_000582002 [Camelus ferus]|nr:hypothetical protein CB1_000582002 [Camelus ferus]